MSWLADVFWFCVEYWPGLLFYVVTWVVIVWWSCNSWAPRRPVVVPFESLPDSVVELWVLECFERRLGRDYPWLGCGCPGSCPGRGTTFCCRFVRGG